MANAWLTFTKNFTAMRSNNSFAFMDYCVRKADRLASGYSRR